MEYILCCPHCNTSIWVESVNCAIFRCGVYKHNGEPIHPHLGEQESIALVKENKIWGCGNPFQLVEDKLIKCGWI